MSYWGGIGATFTIPSSEWAAERMTIEAIIKDMPDGKEGQSGFYNFIYDGKINIDGRVRAVQDNDHAAQVLGWFVKVCDLWLPPLAEIEFDYDGGPRYRYVWEDGKLTKLKGVLDS